jgi:putative mRNA 3-end processing factor
VLVRWLREQGLEAGSFRTEYGHEENDDDPRDHSAPATATGTQAA